ncbi:hypothetical protein AAG570_001040 [Ranatra chinensis]|uniref:Reverse transcriptase n=1 Tax=Ranatra chinensis TaxID=642074 RepID=A0ABD0YAN8_9HEMI
MINRLEEYCGLWNLAINLRKSKTVIFRKGGRIRDIKLTYMKQNIEIANEYNYLGVIFTPKLVFEKQINRKVTQAKLGLNTIWKRFIQKEEIELEAKMPIFRSVVRTIVSYAVVGHEEI